MKKLLTMILLLFIIVNINDAKPRKSKIKKKKTKTNVSFNIKSNLVSEISIVEGLNYKIYNFSSRRALQRLHVIEMFTSSDLSLEFLKAYNCVGENCKLYQMLNDFDSIYGCINLCGINASFWSGGVSYPIGGTFINGEIVELKPYKNWSSFYVSLSGEPTIDTFKLSSKLYVNGIEFNIDKYNRRSDSNEIVIYNKFCGGRVPNIKFDDIENEVKEILEELYFETEYIDSSDIEIAEATLKEQLIAEKMMSAKEHKYTKVLCRTNQIPFINQTNDYIVFAILDSGEARIKDNEIIISLPINKSIINESYFKVGDVVQIQTATNINRNVVYKDGISSIARIVRNNIDKHEAQKEGSRSKRFINKRLPRTAIGYNEDKSILYLAALQTNGEYKYLTGATLQEMAKLMKSIGCSDALNLDGGGSTSMNVNKNNVLRPNSPEKGRKISVGLGIFKCNNNE